MMLVYISGTLIAMKKDRLLLIVLGVHLIVWICLLLRGDYPLRHSVKDDAWLTKDLSRVAPDLSRVAPDLSRVAPDLSRVAPDLSRVAPDLSRVEPDLSRVEPDISRVEPDLSLVEPPSNLDGLAQTDNIESTDGSSGQQPRTSEKVGESINNQPRDCHKILGENEEWSSPTAPDSLQDYQQDNRNLSEYICKEWLLPPFMGPRKLEDPEKEHYSQRGQSEYIDSLLEHKRNGFYIESGAADGEGLSNSLFFEKSRNWTGLLVEANPDCFQSLLGKRRHAYTVNACLSPTTKPMVIPFRMASYIGGLTQYMEKSHKERIQREFADGETIPIQCFPLFSILQAMGVSHVDYFSLDIEGAEVDILKTLPLDQISVDVFSIEFEVSGNDTASQQKLNQINKYLVLQYGYKIVKHLAEDIILKRNHI